MLHCFKYMLLFGGTSCVCSKKRCVSVMETGLFGVQRQATVMEGC